MSYPITVEAVTIQIAEDEDVFPVHRIYCVGQNYADHAREMGNNPIASSPSSLQAFGCCGAER